MAIVAVEAEGNTWRVGSRTHSRFRRLQSPQTGKVLRAHFLRLILVLTEVLSQDTTRCEHLPVAAGKTACLVML